jgi:hypothetical protein
MDISSVPEESIIELHAQAAACLQGTVQLAIAADQRATTLTGIFGAGTVALLAAAATVLEGSHPSQPLVWSACIAAEFLFAASLCCAWAARPINFSVGGYEPKLLAPAASDKLWMLRCVTEDIQARIDMNRLALDRGARILTAATLIALSSVPAGFIAFEVVIHLS